MDALESSCGGVGMLVTKRVLEDLGVPSGRAEKYLPSLNEALGEHGIDTPLRVAHFLAQVLHESAKLKFVAENLNYSEKALLRVFKKYFTPALAKKYARDPERIGCRVYANRMGNGDEASGEGFRYRGRGLIQLTGKTNYRAFAKWIEDDIVADPDRVADKYAVHSAVFYWTTNKLNAIADVDDVKLMTKRINGGLNGLDDRMHLLEKAKASLGVEPPALGRVSHRVTATRLNLRSRPEVSSATLIGSLDQGDEVEKTGPAGVPDWVKIRALLHGRLAEGFVAGRFLEPIPARVAARAPRPRGLEVLLPPVHLKEGRPDVTRRRDGGRAFPLGEKRLPRRTGTKRETKVRQLLNIVDYLNSQSAKHLRYRPKGRTTFCNIYAHDYCYLAGVYLPRVWWTEHALRRLRKGERVAVRYGTSVRELNVNMLHDWFSDYGPDFGWKRVLSLDVLQAAANNGEVCVIVAQRADLNRSGHIAVVVPEHDGQAAKRNAAGEVIRPLESQAGMKNHRFVTKSRAWWRDQRFASFQFWRHA